MRTYDTFDPVDTLEMYTETERAQQVLKAKERRKTILKDLKKSKGTRIDLTKE